jgi:hypothetical protein
MQPVGAMSPLDALTKRIFYASSVSMVRRAALGTPYLLIPFHFMTRKKGTHLF